MLHCSNEGDAEAVEPSQNYTPHKNLQNISENQ